MFYVYILKCSDGSYYTGHTDDFEKRISEHMQGKGCGYTKTRLPIDVVFMQICATRYEALRAEHQIKKWGRSKKEALIEKNWKKLCELSKNYTQFKK